MEGFTVWSNQLNDAVTTLTWGVGIALALCLGILLMLSSISTPRAPIAEQE